LSALPGWGVSFDPALRSPGYAFWFDGVLRAAGALKGAKRPARGPAAWAEIARQLHTETYVTGAVPDWVVVEQQRKYPRKRVRFDDLLELAGVAGAAVRTANATTAIGYYPDQWKGEVPKDVTEARARALLTPAELAVVEDEDKSDTWDAIGLGLVALGRLSAPRSTVARASTPARRGAPRRSARGVRATRSNSRSAP